MPLYEEVEIEDFSYDPVAREYTYPCPCGDIFKVTLEELWDGEDIARCPSCTLFVQVIYDEEDLPELPEDGSDDDDDTSIDHAVEDDVPVTKKSQEDEEKTAVVVEENEPTDAAAVKSKKDCEDKATTIQHDMEQKLSISSQ
jgi:diphthamide biosynthesis protein 3